MKERILKLLRKSAKEYYVVWKKGTHTYETNLERDGFCNEWNYYK